MQEKIDILITKKLSGNATEQENAALEAWISAEPANADYYAQMERTWRLSSNAGKQQDSDVNAAWTEFVQISRTKHPPRRLVTVPQMAIAASILFIVCTVFVLRFVMQPDPQQVAFKKVEIPKADTFVSEAVVEQDVDSVVPEEAVKSEVKSKVVRKRTKTPAMIAVSSEDSAMVFKLPDGSKVYLNRNSKLMYQEGLASGRSVFLSGEAFFEVSEGTTPFIVTCHDVKSVAMGGSFNVKGLMDGQVEVSAIEGDLTVTSPGNTKEIHVKRGEQLTYNAATGSFKTAKVSKKNKWWKMTGFRTKIREFLNKITHKIKVEN